MRAKDGHLAGPGRLDDILPAAGDQRPADEHQLGAGNKAHQLSEGVGDINTDTRLNRLPGTAQHRIDANRFQLPGYLLAAYGMSRDDDEQMLIPKAGLTP